MAVSWKRNQDNRFTLGLILGRFLIRWAGLVWWVLYLSMKVSEIRNRNLNILVTLGLIPQRFLIRWAGLVWVCFYFYMWVSEIWKRNQDNMDTIYLIKQKPGQAGHSMCNTCEVSNQMSWPCVGVFYIYLWVCPRYVSRLQVSADMTEITPVHWWLLEELLDYFYRSKS